MCGPHRRFAPLLSRTLRLIPWTVRTVATLNYTLTVFTYLRKRFNTVNGRCCCNVSKKWRNGSTLTSFNTMNGKDCCNLQQLKETSGVKIVSIPWTVKTVALSPLFYLHFVPVLAMCGPHRRFAPLLPHTLRRIPYTVRTVATKDQIILRSHQFVFQYRER